MYLISDAGASCNEKDTIESVMLTRNLNYLVGIKLDVKETIDNVFVIAQSNNLNVFAMSNYQISNLDYSFLKKIKFPSHIFKYYIPTLEEILINYNHDNKEGIKFNKDDFNLKNNESKSFNFKLVIQDGNPSCKYRLDFNMNNVNLSIYSYHEDYELSKFTYIHNPSYLDKVLIDADEDDNAVFGYKPNNTGSLKMYADYDWYDSDKILEAKEERINYINDNDKRIKELENKLRKENKNIEEIARACSNLRNQIRLEQYKDNPEGLEQLKQRNLEKYGHEEGPLPEELYVKYNNSWEMVLEKCYSTNRAMDACCGVYDMYFNMYTPLAY
jgi:hypothetical protein